MKIKKKSIRSYVDERELRKRRRERIIMLVVGFLAIAFTILASQFSDRGDLPISANILVYGLTSINIILILLLIFLIVRNIFKLFSERRKGVIGSKLRTKLVVAFVGLSLVPTILLFLFAINFLSYSIEFWFNIKIGDALNRSLEVAQLYYTQAEEMAKFNARQISADITKNRLYEDDKAEYLNSLLSQRQKNYKVGKVEAFFDFKKESIVFADAENPSLPAIELSPKMLEDIYSGKEVSTIVPTSIGESIVGIVPVFSYAVPTEVIGRVSISYSVPQGFVDKLRSIANATEQYGQIKLLKNPIKFNYIVTLSIVTLVIIFLATWFGLSLAQSITNPIQDLVSATNRITQGDLTSRIDIDADDEIGLLVKSFNHMTEDLQKSKSGLIEANISLEERRKYMAAVLRNVSAGIISVDKNDMITTINRAAESMFDINASQYLFRNYRELLLEEHIALVDSFLLEMKENNERILQKQLELTLRDRSLTILLTITTIEDEEGNDSGIVIVFEDLTELQKAERAAAWREVARRMAHEIKNPLTPVQLSAQRLQRKYGEKLGTEDTVFKECTQTIIDQVEVLKNLVNEFSRYARMPVTTLAINDLNVVVSEAVTLFVDAHKDIHFEFRPAEGLPKFNLDAEQINRVMINLLDNAVASINKKTGHIGVIIRYDESRRKVTVAVADDGAGVPPSYKRKVFEPYFSTKKAGTGLGLAIVSSIISDHKGEVTVSDNYPTGTIVSFQLPVGDV
ncbi:MAG: Sensor histidine kinase YycG [Deltaproteobacteria bacterium ADurb.Bin151]|jgi:two-component system nitrogen regulation sensor histidine kinase NtrY|nr:HAMP domain-containing protein [Smithella sp.]OQB54588.1 MAG: Sensor histidine kinase YycG [Deltaproteobacteria bacterium ADurb.Bin151]HNZ09884.1 ATP-binding protein [Smithellaceae bacterium]HOG80847.1 ATP-binding protein [Smithellaceae bacterium]HOQ42043.1 ATP-binding protein [Smithellaceae bacterium]